MSKRIEAERGIGTVSLPTSSPTASPSLSPKPTSLPDTIDDWQAQVFGSVQAISARAELDQAAIDLGDSQWGKIALESAKTRLLRAVKLIDAMLLMDNVCSKCGKVKAVNAPCSICHPVSTSEVL